MHATAEGLLDRWLRTGRTGHDEVVRDLCWLLGLGLLLIGAGMGLRDPWPADEPRFALIARDMLRSGDWLIPRVGGDLYPDKPPFFFWLLAASMALTGSVRSGFLVPSLLAGLGTVVLVYDLLRRARGRETGLAGGLLLLCTFQFVWQARQAQIDATLCFLATLSLYSLLRSCLLDGGLRWWLVGWAAAGLGVITKGVGFLPLLVLLPVVWLARRGWRIQCPRGVAPWLGGVAAFLAAIGIWFVPMLIATAGNAELAAYRDEILFQQTVTRYASAWHHHKPFWYYIVQVVPALWLPAIALLPWLWKRWRDAIRQQDALVAVLLCWVVIVLVFFSASSGKRGVYVLPAVPAFVMAATPAFVNLVRDRGPRRLLFTLAALLVVVCAGLAAYLWFDDTAALRLISQYPGDPALPFAIAAGVGAVALLICRQRDAWFAYVAVLGTVLVTIGLVIYPNIDPIRSSRLFTLDLERDTQRVRELGLVEFREQFLLEMSRPSYNFGHARWREYQQEAADAAAWLAQDPSRGLVMPRRAKDECFPGLVQPPIGFESDRDWYLVTGQPSRACLERGDASRARLYQPP